MILSAYTPLLSLSLGVHDSEIDQLQSMSASSWTEVDGDDIVGMSVVFHCNGDVGGDRVFCAPFEDLTTGSASRPTQSSYE